MRSLKTVAWNLACWLLLAGWVTADERCVQFRGNRGNGVVPETSIPTNWSAERNVAWTTPLEGSGWSQPVVLNGGVYVTSVAAEQLPKPMRFRQGVSQPQSMGLGGISKAPTWDVQWQLTRIDRQTGQPDWNTVVAVGPPKIPTHPSNTFATETPAVDERGVYVWYGSFGLLAAVDHAGKVLWKREFPTQRMSNGFGTGSSVVLHDGRLYLQRFGEESASIDCVSTETGQVIWSAQREKSTSAWSTPLVWTNRERAELIVSAGNEVDSYDLLSGERLWRIRGSKAATACSVACDDQRLYFGGSDPFAQGALFAVEPGGEGELSDGKSKPFQRCSWQQPKSAPGMSSPVSDGQHVYVVSDSIIRCYRADTGERVYQERLPEIKNVAASPLLLGDRLLVLDESGSACQVAAGAKFEVVGQGKLDDTFWATPAATQTALLLRGVDALYCIQAMGDADSAASKAALSR
jgi:outer membrane protein assembly factor BamB